MSERSSRYTPDNYIPSSLWEIGDFSYKWSDPNTPSDYYQSYVTTGLASVDSSIWLFQRPDDIYSLGYAISVLHNGTPSHPHRPTWHSIRNNYKRNFECPAMYVSGSAYPYPFNSNLYFYSSKYSPDAIQYNIDTYQRFILNFKYNDIVLYPLFDIEYLNGSTYTQVTGLNFAELQEYFTNYGIVYIIKMQINTYYGKTNELNQERAQQDFYPYIQFAGSIPTLSKAASQDTIFLNENGVSSGVFIMPTNFLLFDFPNYYYKGTEPNYDYGIYAPTTTSRSCILPFDASFVVEFEKANYLWRFGVPDLDVVKNIMDRLGYNWAKTLQSAKTSKTGSHCTDPNIRCAVIDPETNIIQTEAYEGSEISDYANANPESSFNWDTGAYDYNGVTIPEIVQNTNPEQPTTEPADEIDLNEPVLATSGGTSIWLMNQEKLEEFFIYLWNPDGTLFDDIVKSVALLGENPMDSVISCRFFPLDLANIFGSKFDSNYRTIIFGRKATTVNARHLTSSNVAIYDLGSFYFNDSGMFNDFRDYEPYSRYSLYLPFVGIEPLSAIECIGKTITIKYIIDLVTGACTAVIFTDGVPYKYIDGMIGIEIPVTGRNMAQYGQQILGAAMGGAAAGLMKGSNMGESLVDSGMGVSKDAFRKAGNNFANGATRRGVMHVAGGSAMAVAAQAAPAVLGAAYGIASGGVAGAASALLNNPAPQMAGSNVPAMGLAKPLYAYFIVERSDSWIPENYAELYGRPLNKGGTVGQFSGFSVFGSVKLESISGATTEEKTLISKILASGVYI